MKINTEMYEIYNHKLKRDYTICLLADIHNTKYSSKKMWSILIQKIINYKPDFIFIAGDIIYSADDLFEEKTLQNLNYLLSGLSKISPVFVSLGNHDLKDGKFHKANEVVDYFKKFQQEHQIYFLNNGVCTSFDINVLGINPCFESYYLKYKNNWNRYFIEALLKNRELYDKVENNKYNVMITHSPEIICNLEKYIESLLSDNKDNSLFKIDDLIRVKLLLQSIDLFVCGHMHDGLVPKHWQRLGLVKEDIGIMVSEGDTIRDVTLRKTGKCRGVHKIYNGEMIITGGITKWCHPNIVFSFIDKLWSKDVTIIKVRKK